MVSGADDERGGKQVSRKASVRAGDQKMVWTEPLALPWLWGLHGRPGARGPDGAVLIDTEGVFGGVREAAGGGNVPATEPAACGGTQVPRWTEEVVFGEGAVEPNGR